MKNQLALYSTLGLFIFLAEGCTKDTTPNPNLVLCGTKGVSYTKDIVPILNTHCNTAGCHNSTTAAGGYNLTGYAAVKTIADNGKLYGTVSFSSGFKPMPQGGSKLPDSTINKIKTWIDDCALNN